MVNKTSLGGDVTGLDKIRHFFGDLGPEQLQGSGCEPTVQADQNCWTQDCVQSPPCATPFEGREALNSPQLVELLNSKCAEFESEILHRDLDA